MDSKALLLRTAHRFEVNVINTTELRCSGELEPHRLWDSDSKSFITDGYEFFTGILVFEISHDQKHERIGTLGRSTNYRWYHKSNYIAIFGLQKGDTEVQSRATEATSLTPWAALYKHDGENEVSRILSHEGTQEEHFSNQANSQDLVRVGAYLRTHLATGGQRLPMSLTTYPQWSRSGYVGPPQSESFIDTSSIEIIVSTKMKAMRSPSMYEGSLKISETQN